MQPVELRRTFAKHALRALDVAAHLMQRGDDAGLPWVATIQHRQPQRLLLDHRAHPCDVDEIVTADLGDAKAALPDADDQAARHQPRQSLAQRRRPDLVALGKLDDPKPRAGGEDAGDDIALDQRGGALAERVAARRLGLEDRALCRHQSRISFLRSSLVCSIFCADITSIHQASCSGFSTGSD